MSFRGNGFDPELPGEDAEERAGEGAMPLLEEEARRKRRVDAGSTREPSLGLLLAKDAELAGEVPVVAGLTVMTPATPLPAGNKSAPPLG